MKQTGYIKIQDSRRRSVAGRDPWRAIAVCLASTLVALLATGCISMTSLGKGGSLASGSSSAAARKGGTVRLERCTEPLGNIALVEDESTRLLLAKTSEDVQIPASPLPLLRLLFQQSNCFRVVDRASGLRAIDMEQALASRGLLREDSDLGTGQMLVADYSLTPHLVFAEEGAGRLGLTGSLLGLAVLGPLGLLAGGVTLDQSEAQVVMFLTDNRSGIQVAAAEGSAKVSDLGFDLFGSGANGEGTLMGWGHSNTGKVVAAALVDGLNKIVQVARQRAS